jgi:DeoR/GlpR family transcriptional regulator of sugar metabolism
MLKKERHASIMRQINLHNRVLTADLVQLLNVSEDTVRRDLQEMLDQHLLYRVHGGALSKSYHATFNDSVVYAKEAKASIAQKTIPLIKDSKTILTGGGTTIIELVKHLPTDLQATFFTVSPLVAVELCKYPNIDVTLFGGLYSKNSQITYGGLVMNQLADINVDLCLLGTSAIHHEDGLTDTNWEINRLKKQMLNTAKKSAVLCISEKLNISLRLKVSPLANINFLVTELAPTEERLKQYQNKGLKII